MATPTMIQHISSAANAGGGTGSPAGNAFKVPITHPIGAANCIILCLTFTSGLTATITDNNSNSWPVATVTADAGGSFGKSQIFVLPNANAGQTTLTVTFGSTTAMFSYTVSEWMNVATASPVDGASTVGFNSTVFNCPAAPYTTGSFHPTNAAGNDLIFAYYAYNGGNQNATPTNWTPGGSFILLDGNFGNGVTGSSGGLPHASMYFIQASSAAINPSITMTGDTSDTVNALGIALKSASAGTARSAGLHVDRLIHQTSQQLSGSFISRVPFTGNLRVIVCGFTRTLADITGVTDSDGNTWTSATASNDEPMIFYKVNTTPSTSTIITMATTGTLSGLTSYRVYDISGAATSPFDNFVGVAATSFSTGSVTNAPSITPVANTNGMTLATVLVNLGNAHSVTGPTGSVYDACDYTGNSSADTLENADGFGHLFYTSNAAQTWAWTMTANTGNVWRAAAITFIAASAAVVDAPTYFKPQSFPSQWNVNRQLLLHRSPGPEHTSAPETNPQFRPQTYPPQWNRNPILLVKTGAGPEFSYGTDLTNPQFRSNTYPPQWNRNSILLIKTGAGPEFSYGTDLTNPQFRPQTYPPQWNPYKPLITQPAVDTMAAAPADARQSYVSGHWPLQWNLTRSLIQQRTDYALQDVPPSYVSGHFPPQWNLDQKLLLHRSPGPETTSAPDTPSQWRGSFWPTQWSLTRALFQSAGDYASRDVPTYYVSRSLPWPVQWNVDYRFLLHRSTGPETSTAVEIPSYFTPTQWQSQWKIDISLVHGGGNDESAPTVETNPQWQSKSWSIQWLPALLLLHNPAIDTAGPPPDAPTYVAPFQWMSQWDVDVSLVQGGALDETASVPTVETNPQWIGTTWALQWNKQLSLWQNSALDVPAVVVVPPPDAPTYVAPFQWMSQWDVDVSLVQGGALDETMPATETNVHFIPYGWRYSWASQWSLQASLLQGTAQDFSSVAPTNLLLLRTLMGTGL